MLSSENLKLLRKLFDFKGIFIFSEGDVEYVFERFYRFLGFNKISPIPDAYRVSIGKRIRASTYGDYIAFQDQKSLHVELEVIGSSFFIHKSDVRNKIDVLIAATISQGTCERLKKENPKIKPIALSEYFELCIIYGLQAEVEISYMLKQFKFVGLK